MKNIAVCDRFIGRKPGRCYSMGVSHPEAFAAGTNLVLNSAEAPFNALTVYGHSTQDGTPSPENPVPIVSAGSVMTTGAQLFDASKLQTQSAGGATMTNNGDGSFTVSGSGNLSSVFSYYYDYSHEETITLLQSGKTIKVAQTSTVIPTIVMQLRQGETTQQTVSTTGYTITGEDIQNPDFHIRLLIYGSSGTEIVPGTYKPMVYQDGDGTWEPYTGGVPGVNPYEGEINVTVQGGNLLDKSQIELGGLNGSTGNETGLTARIRTGFIPVTGGQRYTISGYIPLAIANSHVFTSDKSTRLGSFPYNSELPLNAAFVRFSFSKSDQSDLTEEELEALKNTLVFNAGSTALPYEPYKQPQTLTAQTPGGLPGILVSTGGNYTDESGQQWVCDEKDYKRGKYVQRVKCARLSGNIYDTEISLGRYIINISNIFGSIPNVRYPVITSVASTIEPITQSIQNQIFQYGDGIYWYCTDYISSKEELQTFLEENDVTIIGHLAEPIETDLPAEEIAAYKALHTYTPNTTVSNDADAWMKVGYYGLSAIQKLEKEALLINGGKSK